MSKMNLKNFTMLFSVGVAFDKDSGNTFAINADSTIDFDNPVNILECDEEWFDNLDLLDFDVELISHTGLHHTNHQHHKEQMNQMEY